MTNYTTYYPEDKMVSLIKDNYRLIQVMSRFGIPMGFGDDTVKQVCEKNKVDCNTFLTVVNFIVDENFTFPFENISLQSLIHYLKQSHIYFLEFCLPAIRRKLLDGIIMRDSDVSFLIIKLFDEYVAEISAHMIEEEETLFTYYDALLNKKNLIPTQVATYSAAYHDRVGEKLKELKNIIIKYCPEDAKTNLLYAALYDIYRCEEELFSHSRIEDYILLPSLNNLKESI